MSARTIECPHCPAEHRHTSRHRPVVGYHCLAADCRCPGSEIDPEPKRAVPRSDPSHKTPEREPVGSAHGHDAIEAWLRTTSGSAATVIGTYDPDPETAVLIECTAAVLRLADVAAQVRVVGYLFDRFDRPRQYLGAHEESP